MRTIISIRAIIAAAILGVFLSATSCEIVDIQGPSASAPARSVVLDGETYPILSAEIEQEWLNDGIYNILLYFSGDRSKCIKIEAEREKHSGKTTDLTKPENSQNGNYLNVTAVNGRVVLFDAYLDVDNPRLFSAGTFYIKHLDEGTSFEIILNDGSITDSKGDGKPHTITINYKGELSQPLPDNSVVLDGYTYPISSAEIIKSDLDAGNYDIYMYLSKSDFIRIGVNKTQHNGKAVNLAKSESSHDGWSPIVEASIDGKFPFRAYLLEGFDRLFSTGYLYVNQVSGTTFEILLGNGKVTMSDPKFGDGDTHFISIDYSGELTLR